MDERANRAKKDLYEYKSLKVRISQLASDIEQIEHRISGLGGSCEGERVQGGVIIPQSEKIANLVDKKAKLERMQDLLDSKLLEIEDGLMQVATDYGCLESNILHYKFVDLATLEEICVKINYSYRQICRVYEASLIHYFISTQGEL